MRLRTVLVDDEPLARELLAVLLAAHEDIDLVAQCKNGREAIEYLKAHAQAETVDLLFLDIQMPAVSGFDVVEQVGLRNLPPTIFVTAYHEHAVRAFDVQAVDYLTKPVEPERLEAALARVRERIAAKVALLTQAQFTAMLAGMQTSAATEREYATRFLVRDGEKDILLAVEKIEWIEAAEYYCCLHSKGRRYMLRETISDMADGLDPRKFVRIDRSSIVNLDQIREIYREGAEENSVVLIDGTQLKMSKAGRKRLLEYGRAQSK